MSVSPHMNTAHPRSLARRLWLGSSLLGVAALGEPDLLIEIEAIAVLAD